MGRIYPLAVAPAAAPRRRLQTSSSCATVARNVSETVKEKGQGSQRESKERYPDRNRTSPPRCMGQTMGRFYRDGIQMAQGMAQGGSLKRKRYGRRHLHFPPPIKVTNANG